MNKEHFALVLLCLVALSVAFIAGCSASPGGTGTPVAPFAANWWVDGVSGSDSNTGSGYTSPFKTIMKAMSKVGTNETIGVLGATYNEYIMWPAKDNVTLRGSGYVYIDGENRHRCVSVEGIAGLKKMTLMDIRIRNGSVETNASPIYGGSGMFINLRGLTAYLSNVHFDSNGTTVNLGGGGGLFIGQPTPVSGNNSTVEANKCYFYNNVSKSMGGAILCYNANAYLTSCEVCNNSASGIGGISINNGTGRLVNTTIFGNKASTSQGGLTCVPGAFPTVEVINCTITSNEGMTDYPGGVYVTKARIINTIIWGNTCDASSMPDSFDIYDNGDSYVAYSDIGVPNASYTNGPGNISVDPKFNQYPPSTSGWSVSLKYQTSPKSVAYGGTIEARVPGCDFYGTARTTTTEAGYSGYSMGAFESDNPAP